MNFVRTHCLAALLAVSLLPLVVVFCLVSVYMSNALRNSEKQKLSETTREISQHIGVIMQGARRDLTSLKSNPILTTIDSSEEEQLAEMRRLVDAYDSYSDISLYDANGFLINSTTDAVPIWKEYTTWFQTALKEKRNTISDPLPMNGVPGLHLSVYLPLIDSKENVRNIIVARLSFSRISDMLQNVRIGENGFIVLVNHLGNSIVDGSTYSESGSLMTNAREMSDWIVQPRGQYKAVNGSSFLYQATELTPTETGMNQPWVLLAMKPMVEVSAIANQTKLFLLGTFGLSIIFAGVVGVRMADGIARPLSRAGDAAEKVAKGDLQVRLPEGEGTAELRQLSQSFNQMVEEVASSRSALEKQVDERTEDLQVSREELERSASQLRAAFDAVQEGILVTAEDGSIVAVNRPFYDALGFDVNESILTKEQLKEAMEARLDPEALNLDAAFRALTSTAGGILQAEWQLSEDGNDVVEIFSAPIHNTTHEILGRITVVHDIREKRELEEGLRQASKMEAVGQMAGGVAHDFNNLLTGVLGNLSLVEMDLDRELNPFASEHLENAQKAGARAADLVKKLLGFSRRSHMNLEPCDVNEVIAEAHSLLETTLDPKIKIKFDRGDSLWGVIADGTLLNQVIMNLGGNARDAMPPQGGTITISTRNRSLNSDYARNIPEARPGDHVCISVQDDGTGMSKEVMEHVFEPFFTTKEQGKGTGLGLATSFGIIQQLGGWITLDSEIGVGTIFEIFIPRSAAAEAQPKPTNIITKQENKKGECLHETILLVDDEFVVRKVAHNMLEKLGYNVLLASNGEEALQIYANSESEIDLIMLDLTMPTLSGKETFKRLRSQYVYVPVMICSGYLLDLTEFQEETGHAPDGFVQKPYKYEGLADTLREILDAPAVAA